MQMIILFKALQVVLALSLLIIIHELGHFMWCRIFHIRVEKFYLFFDVGGKALLRKKIGETEFGIGWLPLGGYCKISGMIDESLDLKQMKSEAKAWEYRSHPAWQRLLVTFGGVLNNFIFAVLAFIAIMAIWGQSYIPNSGSKIYPDALAEEMGFRRGDEILKMDEYVPANFGMLQADLARRNVQYVKVLRGSDTLDLYIDRNRIGEVLNTAGMFDLALPFVVDSLMSNGINAGADLRSGDIVRAINGSAVEFVQDSRKTLDSLKGREVMVTLVRDGELLQMPLQVDTSGFLGVWLRLPNIRQQKYNVIEAVPAGLNLFASTTVGYLRDLRLLSKPKTGAYKSVGSFVAIGQVFPSRWSWYQFLFILAMLSIILGVMNLLPIPGLDGGHMLFTAFEMVTGRKPSDRFMMVAQMVGMALLIMLMLLAFGNDIGRLIH